MGPSQPYLADGTPYVLAQYPIWNSNVQSKNRMHHFSTSAFPVTSNPQAFSILDRGRQNHLENIWKRSWDSEGMVFVSSGPFQTQDLEGSQFQEFSASITRHLEVFPFHFSRNTLGPLTWKHNIDFLLRSVGFTSSELSGSTPFKTM